MLVLTRKVREEIRIGESVTVTILGIKGSSVRVGVEAPREVRVLRGELEAKSPSQEVGGELRSAAAAGSGDQRRACAPRQACVSIRSRHGPASKSQARSVKSQRHSKQQ
jgi:carbon storage regulator CsrA